MIHLRLVVLAFVLIACEKGVAPHEPWIVEGSGDKIINVPSGVILVDISATTFVQGTVQVEVKCLLESGIWWPETTFVLGTAQGLSPKGSSRENISDCLQLSFETTPQDHDDIRWTIEKVQ